MRITILLAVIFSLLFFNSCNEEPPVVQELTIPPTETIIADNTAQADSNSFKTGLVSIDSSQIVYSGSNSFTQTLVVGGFIVSDYGGGILRKIESIQTQGSQVVIGTRHARLDEVILKGTIDFRGTLSPDGMILEGSSNENVFFNKENGELTISFNNIGFGVSELEINSETSFDPPEFIFHVELNFGIKSFEAGIVVSNVSFLEVNTTGQVNVNSNYSPPWAQIKFLPGIPTPVPFLTIVPIIKVVLGGEVAVEVVSENRVDASTTISGGITYENSTWDNYSTLNQQFNFNSNIVGVNAYAKMGLSIPRVGFYLNGAAGAFIELELYGKFKVANDNQGRYRGVYAGLGGNAGVEASILGFSIQSPLIEIFQNEWELNKEYIGGNTPPEAVFSISPPTGNTSTIFDFDASLSSDNEDPLSALQVRWDWEGDGIWDTPYSITKTETHQYLVPAEYTVKLQVLDSDGLTDIASSTFNVSSVGGNQPPNEPSNPNPPNGSTNQSINTNLSWTGSDPDNDPLTYNVYFGTNSNPPLVKSGHTVTNYNLGTLDNSTQYFWKIVAKDNQGNSTAGPIWYFTTEGGGGNQPPNEPSNPSPINGSTNQSVNTNLSWTGSDPENDPLTYDIYFGTNSNPPLVNSNLSTVSYDPGTLLNNRNYYWKIVAKDNQGNSTTGQIWNFSTEGGELCPGTISYEGKIYNTVLIGNQCWLKENLDVGTMINGSGNQTDNGIIEKYCYDNDPNNCNTYGGLYQWNEAMKYNTYEGAQGICPQGWHVPTYEEFLSLKNEVGDDGNALKEIGQGSGSGAGTNTSGFSALLAGRRGVYNGSFGNLGFESNFWTSWGHDDTFAVLLLLNSYNSDFLGGSSERGNGFSIRCLKD